MKLYQKIMIHSDTRRVEKYKFWGITLLRKEKAPLMDKWSFLGIRISIKNKMKPKVSVVMPIFNTAEEYLREAIDSILNQTFTDFEFIIVDDGSDAYVKAIIDSYKDQRIKYFYKKNSGIADSLNYGISKAVGIYIARMDSDDISLPERFEKEVNFLDAHPDISLVGAWYERFPEFFVPGLPATVGLIDMLKCCAIAHPLVMFRKEDFEARHLFYDPSCCAEDYDLWIRALKAGLRLANIQEILLKYRWHPENYSNKKASEVAQKTKELQQNIITYLTGDDDLQQKISDLLK